MLATLSALKAMLGITDNANDAALTVALKTATATVESYCGRTFARGTLTEALDCRNGDRPVLSRYPVVSLTSVTMGGVAQTLGDYEVTPAGVLSLSSETGPLPLAASYFRVAYTGGYILPGSPGEDLPLDIQQAVLITAAATHLAGARDPMLRSQTADGVGSESYVANNDMAGMPPQAAALLEPWRMVG